MNNSLQNTLELENEQGETYHFSLLPVVIFRYKHTSIKNDTETSL